ncbi:MAG: pyridoxal phosphate-dependent aminotransferase [Lachnospiraceae bacterium]|nr:pyridoxal phosphate-dependent aminotransferase [Lachnospiraceae bacterium]
MSLTLSKRAEAVKPSSTLSITAKAKALKAEGKDVVGFGAGEPDFNTPENIRNAAIDAINSGFTKYTPASGTVELKNAISKKFKDFNGLDYDASQIVVSNGGKHSLINIFRTILNPGDEVIIPAPYWLSYPEMVKLSDGIPVFAFADKASSYKITVDKLEEVVTGKTKALVLNNPNNPTGMLYTKDELEKIADFVVKHDIFCVADEMYENLLYSGEKFVSIASLNKDIYDHTITCSGLSKSYAMTGWRIGYTGSSKQIASLMSAVQSHCTSNPNSIAQKAALEALNGPQDAVSAMRDEFNKRRVYMFDRINKMSLIDCIEPMGAFYVFIDCSEALKLSYKGEKVETTTKMADILLNDYNVAIVPCMDFGFPEHIRLSYAISKEQIEKGLDRIESFLKELK